jgi:hypothetical protein
VAARRNLGDDVVGIRITHVNQSDAWVFVGNLGKTRVIGEMHMRHQPDNVFARRSILEGVSNQQPRIAKHTVIALQQRRPLFLQRLEPFLLVTLGGFRALATALSGAAALAPRPNRRRGADGALPCLIA